MQEERIIRKLKKVIIYTDGACSGNPGPGGYGAILIHENKEKELSGHSSLSTNNKMEMVAAIVALETLKRPCEVKLYSDSAYLVDGIEKKWLLNWKKNGWKTANKKPVKNREEWERLDKQLSIHNVSFIKVKGHSDNEFNNRCDTLATGEIDKNR